MIEKHEDSIYLKYKNALSQFVNYYICDPNVIGVLACGSYVHSKLDKNSDLDVYIILKESEFRERGNTWVNGVEIEYFLNPVKQIKAYFSKEKSMDRFPATAHMFVNSIVLYKSSDIVDSLIEEAENILIKPIPEMNPVGIEFAKYELDDLLKDIDDVYSRKDFFSFNIIANKLIETCIDVFFQIKRIQREKPKRIFKQLSKIDSIFSNLVADSLLENDTKIKFHNIEILTTYTENLLGGRRTKEWKLSSKCEFL